MIRYVLILMVNDVFGSTICVSVGTGTWLIVGTSSTSS